MMTASVKNDNRHYHFENGGFTVRPEYAVIANWIPDGSSVIDLGCGNGSLLHYLGQQKNLTISEGIERAPSGVEYCLGNGLVARAGEIDRRETYAKYDDNAFDFAVCNVTLQMVTYPEVLLEQMARIARRLIVSFPNFGHIFNRLDLLATGRMPRPQLFGYEWFATGHIHQLGIADFLEFCRRRSLRILQERHMGRPVALARLLPRLFSRTAAYLCAKQS